MNAAPSNSGRLELAPGVWVPGAALQFHFSRAGGPGGQNVNKVNTKAELRVRPEALEGLSAAALARLRAAAAWRLTAAGELLLVAETERTQAANRAECLRRLRALVAQARIEPKVRRKTRPTGASRERRLQIKKARSERKQQRREVDE